MNVSLPDGLKAWADARVAQGRYSSASDYVRDLLRRDQDEAEKRARLQAEIDIGLASGTSKRGVTDIIRASRAKS